MFICLSHSSVSSTRRGPGLACHGVPLPGPCPCWPLTACRLVLPRAQAMPQVSKDNFPPHCPSPAHLLVTHLGQCLCPAVFSTKFFFKSRGERPTCRSRVGYNLGVWLRHILVVSGADLGTQKGTTNNTSLSPGFAIHPVNPPGLLGGSGHTLAMQDRE